jgi:hypothetical protein
MDAVVQFLAKLKEQVLYQASKKRVVQLNMLVGVLTFKDGNVDFKTNSVDFVSTPINDEDRLISTGNRS